MASITLKDYLISLSTKGSISDSDLLPLLDSGADNALKKITKGALVNLSDIDGFTEFSSSIEGDLFALSFASGASVETSLQQQIDLNNLGVYTQSLKSAIIVDGTDVQIIGELRADKFYVNYITSSVSLLTGSNEFGDTLADRHTFIGDVYINGDGPIGLLQLNTQTGSQNTLNTSIGLITSSLYGEVSSLNSVFSGVSAVTGAFATELGELQTQNTSQGGVNSGTSAVTGAFATELGGIQTTLSGHRNELSGIEAWTASLDSTYATDAQVADAVAALNTQTGSQNSINSGISAVSGAFATELGQLQNNVTDFTNVLSGVAAVSGAIVTELGGIQSNITSFNNVFSGVSAVTGAFATELGGIQNNISSFNNVFSGVSAVTGAFATELGGIQNNITSFNNVFSGVSAVTGAFATELGEIQTQLTNRRGELNGLEAYTASLKSVGLISSSAQIAVEISGSGFTSASGEFAELTLTRGDGTTAQIDLSPRKVLELVKNKDPQTLPKGTPVYVSGSTGNAAHIYAASASRADRMPAAYVLDQELAFDAEGNGIVVGFINGVNTSAFNEGDNVYVGESGGYTNVKPTGNSNRIQKLGNVIEVHPTNGSGVITGAGRSNDVPNIQEGYMWVGNSSDVATQFTTSSVLGYGHDATFNDVIATGSLSVGTNNLNARLFRVYGSGDLAQFTSTNSGVGGAQIDLTHESATPADGDNLGIINFTGFDSGLNNTQYANIKALASSVASEIGELHFGTRQNSSTYNGSNMILDGDGNLEVVGNISGSALNTTDYVQVKADDAEIYLTKQDNTEYFRFKRSTSDLILDQYDGTNSHDRITVDSAGRINFQTGSYDITTKGVTIDTNGRVLVTTANNVEPLLLNRQDNDGLLVEFRQANGVVGDISVSSGTVSYNPFMGSHYSEGVTDLLKGTVLETIDELVTEKYSSQQRLPKVKVSDTSESSAVYGVWLGDNEQKLVAAVGASWCRINSSVNVQIGDLLTSNGDGTAKVQSDDIIRSKTIGKVTSTIKVETYDDGSYLVPVVLYCG